MDMEMTPTAGIPNWISRLAGLELTCTPLPERAVSAELIAFEETERLFSEGVI